MTKIWKPKEYLFEHGKIDDPKQRGRMSLDNKAFITAAVESGVLIEGYGETTAEDGAVVIDKVSIDPNRVFDVPDESRPEASFTAYVGTKEIGMRTICNVCSNSLNYCHCSSPRVWVDFDREGVVNFAGRTKPTKRWW